MMLGTGFVSSPICVVISEFCVVMNIDYSSTYDYYSRGSVVVPAYVQYEYVPGRGYRMVIQSTLYWGIMSTHVTYYVRHDDQ